jgi:hypothetical protein
MKKILLFTVIVIVSALGFSSRAFAENLLSEWGVTPGSNWDPTKAGVLFDKSVGTLDPGVGGHDFDAEAMYFYHDNSNAYIALVAGIPQDGWPEWSAAPASNLLPGDFALNFGGSWAKGSTLDYQFGIKTSSNDDPKIVGGVGQTGEIYSDVQWGKSYEWNQYNYWGTQNTPTIIKGGTLLGLADFNYYNITGADNQIHYVYEAAIPLATSGMNWTSGGSVHWTMTCGNDAENVNFKGFSTNVAPEPVSAILFLMGGAGLATRKLIKRKK